MTAHCAVSPAPPLGAMRTGTCRLGLGLITAAAQVGGRRVSLVAAGLAAVYPNLWVNDGLLMSETLAALTTALVVWLPAAPPGPVAEATEPEDADLVGVSRPA
jgi:hypothetical protein